MRPGPAAGGSIKAHPGAKVGRAECSAAAANAANSGAANAANSGAANAANNAAANADNSAAANAANNGAANAANNGAATHVPAGFILRFAPAFGGDAGPTATGPGPLRAGCADHQRVADRQVKSSPAAWCASIACAMASAFSSDSFTAR